MTSAIHLKPGVNVIHFDAVLLGDRTDQFGRNDCLDDIFLAVDLTELLSSGDEIVDEHQSGLVTVQQYPFAFVVLNGCTYSVCIRSEANTSSASVSLAFSTARAKAAGSSGLEKQRLGSRRLLRPVRVRG